MLSSHRARVVPDSLPVLSRGKHRNPRRGACFMEMASVLAGERWSDHPRCTHPLLAELARLVNDCTSDGGRSQLAPLVPSVIGLTGGDPRVDAWIALRCAQTALPVASAERQHTLAVAILAANRVLAELDGHPVQQLDERSRQALDGVPEAARWAARFIDHAGIHPRGFRRHTAAAIVRSSVAGIAEACTADADDLLCELLTGVIGDVTALCASSSDRSAANPVAQVQHAVAADDDVWILQ
ncbi:MAG TPA: hypothetical protein VKB75_04750 [Jatrophihabitans sp.]|nr:hypothetical protein [Jatrophihabitans sp.]